MSTFQVDQLDHVELFVPDRRLAADWYERTLGLRVVAAFEHWSANPERPLMISSDGGRTMLALFTGTPRGDRPTAGFHRVAFRVGRQGFAAFLAHVRGQPVYDEAGQAVHELTVRDHGRAHSVYFCDPYGHRLEVTTYEVE